MITILGKSASLDLVRTIPLVTPPNAGSRWAGIRHGDLINTLLEEFYERNWFVTDMKFSLSNIGGPGAVCVGAFELVRPQSHTLLPTAPDGLCLGLGFLNANNRRRPLRLYVGATVQICANGLATGELALEERHTHTLDLHAALATAMDDYVEIAGALSGLVSRLRGQQLVAGEAEQLILGAGQNGLLSWKLVGQVYQEYLAGPPGATVGTAWALLMAFTSVIKQVPVHQQMPRIIEFQSLLSWSGR